jgi:hypothetical protein
MTKTGGSEVDLERSHDVAVIPTARHSDWSVHVAGFGGEQIVNCTNDRDSSANTGPLIAAMQRAVEQVDSQNCQKAAFFRHR